MIFGAVAKEKEKAQGELMGLTGGASGGDILFHEVCEELNIPSEMYLVLPKNDYVKASVADSGPDWVERFDRLCTKLKPKILPIQPACRAGSEQKKITTFGSAPIYGCSIMRWPCRKTISP